MRSFSNNEPRRLKRKPGIKTCNSKNSTMNRIISKHPIKDFDIESFRESVEKEYIEVLRDKKFAEGLRWLKSEKESLKTEIEEISFRVNQRKQVLILTLWEIFWGNFYCRDINMNTPDVLDERLIESAVWAEGLHNFAIPQKSFSEDQQKELKKDAIPYWNSLFMNVRGVLATNTSVPNYSILQRDVLRLIDVMLNSLKIESEERREGLDMSLLVALSAHKKFSQKWEKHMTAHMLAETAEYDRESFNELLNQEIDIYTETKTSNYKQGTIGYKYQIGEAYLSEDCLTDMEVLRGIHPDAGINDFFSKAINLKKCSYEVIDGEKVKINSASTLRDRVKNFYPQYYREKINRD